MIVLDTSGLLAAIDASQRWHAEAARALREAAPPFLLSPFVLAELDYLLTTRVGAHAAAALLGEVGKGAYDLQPFSHQDVDAAAAVIARYADLGIGLADASLVIIARRWSATDILTLDERHFRALTGADDTAFRLLPMDVG